MIDLKKTTSRERSNKPTYGVEELLEVIHFVKEHNRDEMNDFFDSSDCRRRAGCRFR